MFLSLNILYFLHNHFERSHLCYLCYITVTIFTGQKKLPSNKLTATALEQKLIGIDSVKYENAYMLPKDIFMSVIFFFRLFPLYCSDWVNSVVFIFRFTASSFSSTFFPWANLMRFLFCLSYLSVIKFLVASSLYLLCILWDRLSFHLFQVCL